MRSKISLYVIVFSVFMFFGCKEKDTYTKINKGSSPLNNKNLVHKVVINEFIKGGTFIYINVNEGAKKYWMAVPDTDVKVGETYFYKGGAIMVNFKSKQLNKTFDFITFAEGINIIEKATPAHQNSVNTAIKKITKPKNGLSLKELFSNKKAFLNKTVVVRGEVVKINNKIMNKNWVHITDGTQFNDKIDLTVTTKEFVNVGDIITFKGIITLDKDFGQGYVYDILLEDAEVLME